jgi:phospholipase/carboxylesterase
MNNEQGRPFTACRLAILPGYFAEKRVFLLRAGRPYVADFPLKKMKLDTELTHFHNWTLRVRPGTGRRILLLLHGWTGDENSMWIFAHNFPAETWIVAPRAPHIASQGGYSWRAPVTPGTWPSVENMRSSAQALVGLLDDWSQANGLDASTFDVAGFSQGGALTFALGALYPARVGKMAVLAGFAPEGAESILAPGQLSGKSIFVAHGKFDKMVPVEMAGAQVTYCESEVGHKLGAECLTALERYLAT